MHIVLNKNNFFNNLEIIVKQAKAKERVALVLKDNAYGHGILEIARMAKEFGITKAVVRDTKEAHKIEHLFEYILVLADIPEDVSQNIRYTINSFDSIEKFPKGCRVELKVDSGMHRNGVAPVQLEDAFAKIAECGLKLEAVLTHHRSGDELNSVWFWQKENFKQIKLEAAQLAKKFGFEKLRFHSSASAALFRHNDFDEDMARVGIAAYGCLKMPDALHVEGLKPVLSVYAKKLSSRVLQKGQRIGYGGTYEAKEDVVVSNYDFGYGDGFFRICSNNFQTPNGEKLVGRVSMDNSSFISNKEELLVFNDAIKAAEYANTISFEVLVALKENIQRVIV